ncbi:MAG: DUF2520 domain-containing protein [Bacteroidales bacterium]|jgi:predicted short-subunit dehydrogenase-like oxidoreductase (DUF2520 family)|nr:DUF2520 domain-containing protein [Bacteroidales bacterium]
MALDKKSLVIIGAGNVACSLAKLFANKNISLTIAARDVSKITDDFKKIATITNIASVPENAELYLICVKDDAIESVGKSLPNVNGVVAHTSGSVELKSLSRFSNHGVFYPFQSFRKEITLKETNFPILIESSNKNAEEILKDFAELISTKIFFSKPKSRAQLHIAGVFVSNFVNLLYDSGWKCVENNFDALEVLLPIIKETANRIETLPPSELQTGPAIRDDKITIENHLRLLENNPELTTIYKTLTNLLLKKYNHEKLS